MVSLIHALIFIFLPRLKNTREESPNNRENSGYEKREDKLRDRKKININRAKSRKKYLAFLKLKDILGVANIVFYNGFFEWKIL